jgi:hypothetical protein
MGDVAMHVQCVVDVASVELRISTVNLCHKVWQPFVTVYDVEKKGFTPRRLFGLKVREGQQRESGTREVRDLAVGSELSAGIWTMHIDCGVESVRFHHDCELVGGFLKI